jgi:hypothetical protein
LVLDGEGDGVEISTNTHRDVSDGYQENLGPGDGEGFSQVIVGFAAGAGGIQFVEAAPVNWADGWG